MTETLETLEALRVWTRNEIAKCNTILMAAKQGHSIPVGADLEDVAIFFPSSKKDGEYACNVERYRYMIGHSLVSSIELYRLLLASQLARTMREIERIENECREPMTRNFDGSYVHT